MPFEQEMAPHVRRLAAVGALVAMVGAVGAVVAATADRFPRGLVFVAALLIALACAWWAVARGGARRVAGLVGAAVAIGVGGGFVISQGGMLLGADLVTIALLLAALACARSAFRVRAKLRPAPKFEHPVLIYNPKSGGGKAAKFHLADEARRRGIEPHDLTQAPDLRRLVRELIAAGADALAVAGGDGTQAIVASEAAAHGLPYACIPAGTRNHFALDLGVDRDDVVGALDALVNGRERLVDLAEVNGRVFVNNVSLGVYAEAVQRQEYRGAKLKTLLETLPESLTPANEKADGFGWTGPDGRAMRGPAVLLVSNDPYRLGRGIASGTRPRLDAGVLGVMAVELERSNGNPLNRIRQWSTPDFQVTADHELPLGVDGEALVMQPPLVFRSRPGALRALIAPQHPGASPSAAIPPTPWGAFVKLFDVALGRTL